MSNSSELSAATTTTNEPRLARDLLIEAPSVTASYTNEAVMELFARNRSLQNLPVVHEGRPMGLINRALFHNMMAKPYYPELYSRHSCIAFMDKSPLLVETGESIQAVTAKAVHTGEKVFSDGFIIVEDGQYRGVGQVLDLMRAMMGLQARQHRQLMDSIEYASVIQHSLLKPSEQALGHSLTGAHWLVWRPRDTVGGDIFHVVEVEDGFLVALFDCTGHGVPGAFMTLITGAAFDRAVTRHGVDDPAALLGSMNRHIKRQLNQHESKGTDLMANSDDGLDGVIVRYWSEQRRLCYAAARQPLFHVSRLEDGFAQCESHKGERHGVGYANTPADYQWHNHELGVDPGDRIYLVSDGVTDQIGGPRQIGFGKRRLKQFLAQSHKLGMREQKIAFEELFDNWRGSQPARDDVSIIGLTLN
ncbi:MAG: SpoIIE family protein phosphatase [Halothiobacillaceae bacterium]